MIVTLLDQQNPTDTEAYFLVGKFTYKYTPRGVLYRVANRDTRQETEVEVDFDYFDKATQLKVWEAIETAKKKRQEVIDLLDAVRANGPYGLGFDLIEVTPNYGSRQNGAILLSHPLLGGWNLINNANSNFALTKVQKLD